MEVNKLVLALESKDLDYAYKALKELEEISKASNKVYPYFDKFLCFLKEKSSYMRGKGIILILVNAKWDKENQIEKNINIILNSLRDEKPSVIRQTIKYLPLLVKYKRPLKEQVAKALEEIPVEEFKESMAPLIKKDIKLALEQINKF